MAYAVFKSLQCIRATGNLITTRHAPQAVRCLTTTTVRHEADVTSKTAPAVPGLIEVEGFEDISSITGHPAEELQGRRVRIFQPAKNAMQSGTASIQGWQLEFDTQERWENPLMGWSSTGDPLSNMQLSFASKQEAVTFCEKNSWHWSVDTRTPIKPKVKSYGANFSWNKNTRTSTK